MTRSIRNATVNLTVTSPPYNVGMGYAAYRDSVPYDEYLEFSRAWLSKCLDLTASRGRLCLNIPLDKNKGGARSVAADITVLAQAVGWKYHATIVWNEQNISRRTAWGSWRSASAPFVIAPVEMIVVLYKDAWARKERDRRSDIGRDEFIQWTNGHWTFPGESPRRAGHPAPFPVELPRRCIRLFSYVGDTVLDPFLGSGSTLLACLETGRRGIGVDIDPTYIRQAETRIRQALAS